MSNVFLTGFMGSGKTVVGRELAQRMGRSFVDTDAEIERRAGRTIPEIFQEQGERAFRELERAVIEDACRVANAVVATGGGAMLDPKSRSRMREAGKIVCLDATPEAVLRRVGSAASRPLLAGARDPLERIRELLAERSTDYAAADFHVETSARTPADVAEEIAGRLGERP